jgi:nucleoid-associated protein EbfC
MSANNIFESLGFNPENMKTMTDKKTEIQDQMAQMQKMLAAVEAIGSAGIENYSVKVTLNGRHEAIRVVIDPQLLTQPIQVLCDLVASAITDASHKTEAAIQSKMLGLLKNFTPPG